MSDFTICSPTELAHIGDETTFTLVVVDRDNNAVDISAATVKSILFRKPDGTIVTQTASFTTDGTDGSIYYTTADTDLDAVGVWKYRAEVTVAGLNKESSTCQITVHSRWTA